MKFSYSTHVLCSCGLGQKCPQLWRKDGSWNPRHGSAGWAARIPTSAGTRAIKRYGYASKAEAAAAAKAAGELLDLAADDATRETQDLERQFAGEAWQDSDLIFCQGDGRPWNPDHVSKRFKKLAAQAGVPVIKLHEGARHTGNSNMRDAGVDQELRMRIVGHSDRDTNDRYTHTLEEAHRAAAEQTAAYVLGDGGTA